MIRRRRHEGNPAPDSSAFRSISVSSTASMVISGPSSVSAPVPVTPGVNPASVSEDPIAELTRKFSQLSLFLQANLKSLADTQAFSNSNHAPDSFAHPPPSHIPRCISCDSTEDLCRDCAEFTAVLKNGIAHFNENDCLINCAIGAEFPLMYGKGGMKVLVQRVMGIATTGNILLEDLYGHLGNSSIQRTTLDLDNNIHRNDVIDVEVSEKRKHNPDPPSHQVRLCTGDSQALVPTPAILPSAFSANPTATSVTPPARHPHAEVDEEMLDVPSIQPFR